MTLAFVRGHLVPYDNLQRRSGSGWGTLIEAWAGQKSVRRKDEDGGSKVGEIFMVSCAATGLMPRAPTLKRGSMKSAGQEAKLSYLGQEELAKRKRSLTEPQRLRQFDKRSFGCHSC